MHIRLAGRIPATIHLLYESAGNDFSTASCMPDDKLHFPFSVKDDFQKFFRNYPFILLTVSDTDSAWLSTACLPEALILLP